jgi:hypothetical protein
MFFQEQVRDLSTGNPNPGGDRRKSVAESCHQPAAPWLRDLPMKLAAGIDPTVVLRRKMLRKQPGLADKTLSDLNTLCEPQLLSLK